MNKKFHNKLSRNRKKLVLVVGGLACVVFIISFICIAAVSNDALHTLRANVLKDPRVLDDVRVISKQNSELLAVNPSYSLHLKMNQKESKELLEKPILKACVQSTSNCSDPTWITYNEMIKQEQIGAPGIDGDTSKVQCTYTWGSITEDGTKDQRDTICIDPDSGDLWYEYFEV